MDIVRSQTYKKGLDMAIILPISRNPLFAYETLLRSALRDLSPNKKEVFFRVRNTPKLWELLGLYWEHCARMHTQDLSFFDILTLREREDVLFVVQFHEEEMLRVLESWENGTSVIPISQRA